MKIYILSTYYKCGGAEIQAVLEKNMLEKELNEVLYITFDPGLRTMESCEKNHINMIGNYSKFNRRLRNVFVDLVLYRKLKKFFEQKKPDIIHLHNITYAFNTIVAATDNIYTIQTVHDYSYLCDKSLMCIRNDRKICYDCSKKNCLKFCFNNGFIDYLKLVYKWHARHLRKQFCIRYVDKMIAPSSLLTNYLNRNGFDALTVNNPMDYSKYSRLKKSLPRYERKVLFLGSVSYRKGIMELVNAYEPEDYKFIQLVIIGNIEDEINSESFFSLINEKKIKYLGYISHEDVMNYLSEIFAVILPSIWMENYPNTALEGMLTECIVCGSDRGGIPELVVDETLIFDVCNVQKIKDCLMHLDTMDETERSRICNKQKEKFYNNNTPEVYLKNLEDIIKQAKPNIIFDGKVNV